MRLLFPSIVSASILAIVVQGTPGAPAASRANETRHPRIEIHAGPPPQRYESPGARRPGKIWVPGYWTWRGDRFVWMKGRYVRRKLDSFVHVPHAGGEADGRYRIFQLAPIERGSDPDRVRPK